MLDQVDTYSGLEPQLQQYIDNMPAGDSKKVEKKIAEFAGSAPKTYKCPFCGALVCFRC